jgi:chromosome segregation and condensation protein ScpB
MSRRRRLSEAQLLVLMTVATFAPISLDEIVAGLALPESEARAVITDLERFRLIQEMGGYFVITRQGNASVGRSGLRKVRDMSRLLYLWRRQH